MEKQMNAKLANAEVHGSSANSTETVAQADIVDTASAAGSFQTLLHAVQAAGLGETLKGAGPFTVFAPTDEAFAKLPAGTIEQLLKPESREQLRTILAYHVVPGAVDSAHVVTLPSAKTVAGADLKIAVADGSVHVENAKVVSPDICASNGIIHVIDAVMLPPGQ